MPLTPAERRGPKEQRNDVAGPSKVGGGCSQCRLEAAIKILVPGRTFELLAKIFSLEEKI